MNEYTRKYEEGQKWGGGGFGFGSGGKEKEKIFHDTVSPLVINPLSRGFGFKAGQGVPPPIWVRIAFFSRKGY